MSRHTLDRRWHCILLATMCFLIASRFLLAEEKSAGHGLKKATVDLAAINDPATLETKVLQDWAPSPRDPAIRQKLIEITVCEWWPGQKVRIPVTLNAPADRGGCENIIVANMGLAPKAALPSGAELRLLKEKGVGVVLVGMGTIDAMQPAGELHLGMKKQLLETKDARFTSAWIWGMSDMRGLTAAMVEKDVFQPKKVLVTGGSKRGVASAMAGIYDPRFTAILPIVAPPIGNPGGAFVVGTDADVVVRENEAFLEKLKMNRISGLPDTAYQALVDRQKRRASERITLEEARQAGWSDAEMAAMNDLAWEVCHTANRYADLKKRGLAIFYNVGTNDNVSPDLLEMGRRHPDFPIYIVPGGQHGGPKDAGATRQVPTLQEVDENLMAFAEHHFFETRPMIQPPKIGYVWDTAARKLRVTATFADDIDPQKNQLSWSVNRHQPYTFAHEYDSWETKDLSKRGKSQWSGEIALDREVKTIEFLTTHSHEVKELPLHVSSPLVELRLPWKLAVVDRLASRANEDFSGWHALRPRRA